ncbi:MAG: FAD-dependent oxidoreductase [Rhodospirillaceae bacterium]|nr:FAD-dependent oxidoreductase [Rhodospirillaceae bacterium]
MLSQWLDEAPLAPQDEAPRLKGDIRADVCIIGGGYCGLWTALALKAREPSLDIVIVEKNRCGDGASGRNGGFVLSWWRSIAALKNVCSTEEAFRLAAASADCINEIADFCRAHAIDCDFRHDGWLWAATNQAQDGAWRSAIETLAGQQVHPFEQWPREKVAARTGSDRHLSGVFEPTAATVQPALLARGLRRVALAQGIRIFENSPMRRLQRARPARIVTAGGTVTADKVVIAMNAWATALAELRRSILVISSDVVATGAFPERLKSSGWADGMAISDSCTLVNYYRTTPDGRVIFGAGGGFLSYGNRVTEKFDGATPRAAEVAGYFQQTYPAFRDVGIASHWTGPIDRSLSGLPFFGRLGGRGDILYGLGFSGNGVGPTMLGGKILASLVLEASDQWSECGLVRDHGGQFPPEPMRYFGGNLVLAAKRRIEALDDQGLKPGFVTRTIAGLAPAGLTKVKG